MASINSPNISKVIPSKINNYFKPLLKYASDELGFI